MLLKDGFSASTCYYKATRFGHNTPDDASVAPENYKILKPVWIGLANKDYVCLAAVYKTTAAQFCPNATLVDFDTDHWLQLAEPDRLNEELSKWVKSLNV